MAGGALGGWGLGGTVRLPPLGFRSHSLEVRSPSGPCQRNLFPLPRAITLENTLVILSTVAPDAGRYYVQAVNDKNGDNKTSQPITLAVESKYAQGRDRSRSGSLNLGNGAPGDH